MKKFFNLVFFVISVLLLVYVIIPSPEFPNPPPEFVQSFEPGDVETPLRRGYYTNLTREEVINYYKDEFNKNFKIYTPRLNYPPEEAQTIIRDQTKSTFLEEIAHPLRESIYINGFEPKTDNYRIEIKGVVWRQKIIIKYIPSSLWTRLVVLSLTIVATFALMKEYNYVKK